MSLTRVNPGDKITAALFNAQTYYLLKGTPSYEDTITLADNVAGTFLLKPTSDPVGVVQLFQVSDAEGNVKFAIGSDGSLIVNGNASFAQTATFTNLVVNGTASINGLTNGSTGATNVFSTLIVNGAASMQTLNVAGQTSLNNLTVSGNASINGEYVQNLQVAGVASVSNLWLTNSATFVPTTEFDTAIKIKDSTNSSGTFKYLRNANNNLQILNNAFSTSLVDVQDGGLVTINAGGLTLPSGNTASVGTLSAQTVVNYGGIRAHRHPYANDRHVESGNANSSSGGGVSVTFTRAYSSAPQVVVATYGAAGGVLAQLDSAPATTGFTFSVWNGTAGTRQNAINTGWHAEGQG